MADIVPDIKDLERLKMSKFYLIIPFTIRGFGKKTSIFRLVFTTSVTITERTIT